MFDPLEFASYFDWFTPTKALVDTIWHGPFGGHTFYVDLDSGWPGAKCCKLLHDAGITTYAECIAKGDVLFTVPKDQAERAEAILLKAGVPLKYHLFSERNRRYLK